MKQERLQMRQQREKPKHMMEGRSQMRNEDKINETQQGEYMNASTHL